jgi:hypothetical protein
MERAMKLSGYTALLSPLYTRRDELRTFSEVEFQFPENEFWTQTAA